MKEGLSLILRILFAAGDLVILLTSLWLSFQFPFASRDVESIIYLYLFSALSWLFLVLVIAPYRHFDEGGSSWIARTTAVFLFLHALTVLALILFMDMTYPVLQILLIYGMYVLTILIWKSLFIAMIRRGRIRAGQLIHYAIVGGERETKAIQSYFERHAGWGYKLVGTFNAAQLASEVVPFESLQRACLQEGVKEIYCPVEETRNINLAPLIDFALTNFIRIMMVPENQTDYQHGIRIDRHLLYEVQRRAAIPLDDPVNRAVKRLFDLLFTSVAAVLVLWWLYPLIAILIKLDSPGPVFFVQIRSGKGNKPFRCMKFRTMQHTNPTAFVQAVKNDPRVTRVGKWLRSTSLDEFPQFINVLKGDMSVVGPRPHPIKLNDDYSPRIRKLMSRHYVKPGITGLAQSMGYRGETVNLPDMKNRITLDRFYVENWSLTFDIRIILQTVVSLIRHRAKAY